MSTYVIGDVQGCMTALRRLLDRIAFDRTVDRLWFVGDLVNRGSESLEVLRFVKHLGSAAITVLGNHDLHLLAVWSQVTSVNNKDTLSAVLDAPDANDLLNWLRHCPLAHWEDEYLMIHAGVLPAWTLDKTLSLAKEVEEALQHDHFRSRLPAIYFRNTRSPESYDKRLGMTTNVLTRLRVCTPEGVPDFSFKGPPQQAPLGYLPWFQIPQRATQSVNILFGHWSALGIVTESHIWALDGGCVWGRELVALRLSDHRLYRVSCSSTA
ncbi:MAG: symmetrical bis(5'-nucleosyl)-tetraphosphatase [Nitrospirales bacterium]|nr:symmetrical bis(5'-nucleosyl)-tetraphosphatase [Nitrospirales bacterium]